MAAQDFIDQRHRGSLVAFALTVQRGDGKVDPPIGILLALEETRESLDGGIELEAAHLPDAEVLQRDSFVRGLRRG
jgi:hypothetical protein